MLGPKRSACDLGGGGGRSRGPSRAGARKRAKGACASACATPAKAPQQRLLDFGQRSLGARVECRACGLVYVRGDPRDEALHDARCAVVREGVALEGFASERVVAALGGGGRVLEVRATDGRAKVAKVEAVREVVGLELGEAPRDGKSDPRDDAAPPSGEGGPPPPPTTERYYLAVVARRVVGLAVVEAVRSASLARDNGDGAVLGAAGREAPCHLGVPVLWVHADHRRRGVATALLDAARRHFFFGFAVPRGDVATSHLTSLGRRFFDAFRPAGTRPLVDTPSPA